MTGVSVIFIDSVQLCRALMFMEFVTLPQGWRRRGCWPWLLVQPSLWHWYHSTGCWIWCRGWSLSTRGQSFLDTWKRWDVFKLSASYLQVPTVDFQNKTSHNLPQCCLQDLSHLHQKIEKLEHLLGDNNRLVAKLHDTLDKHKELLKIGEKANLTLGEALPGCQLAKEVKDGTDGLQVSNSNYGYNTVSLHCWLMPNHLFIRNTEVGSVNM